MKLLKTWHTVFLCLGWICLGLLVLNFFLTSPSWDGLSNQVSGAVFCFTVVFFVASIILSVVKRVIEEIK